MWYLNYMKQVLEKFLDYLLNEKTITKGSAEAYVRHITYLYLEANDNILHTCRKYSDIAELIRRVRVNRAGKRGEHWTENTTAKTAHMAKVFFTWAAREGLIDSNPMQFGHEFRKGKQRPVEYFEQDSKDLKKLFSYPHNSLQDIVIFKLLYASGVRRSELCALNVTDINIEARTAFILEGKGGQYRYAYFDDEVADLLTEHLEAIKIHYPGTKALFVNDQGQRLDAHALTKYMIRRGEKIGVKMNPHKFRHSVGGRIVENGGDIKLAADILGHKSLSSTNMYTHFSKEKTREMYDKFNGKVKIEKPSELIA